jgi:hypothetical protein
MVVVDAAIIVDFLLDLSADAPFVRDRLREESPPWAAPELLDAEVARDSASSVARRAFIFGRTRRTR